MQHVHAVTIALWHTGACRSLDDDYHWRVGAPGDGAGAELLDQALGRPGAVLHQSSGRLPTRLATSMISTERGYCPRTKPSGLPGKR